jgi:hypothetical protein
MANEGQVVNSGSSMSAAQMLLRLTGAATLAAGALLYGDGDASLATLAPGTNGHVLTLAGGLPSWAANAAAALPGSYAVGDLLYASGAATLAKLAAVATGNALISGGVTTAPSWGKIGLTTHVSGILPSANGGTGVNNGAFTLTIPASGTAALLGTANTFTQTNAFAAITATNVTNSALTSGRIALVGTAGLMADSANLTFGSSNTMIGLRRTPHTWGANFCGVEQQGSALAEYYAAGNIQMNWLGNSYDSGAGSFKYSENGPAAAFRMFPLSKLFLWQTAASGLADAAQTLATCMSLDDTGLTLPSTSILTINSTNDAAIVCSGGATLKRATLTHGAITTDIKTLDSTVTWNAGGVAFTAWKLNVTNTASAAGSLLLDLQVGGTSQFSIRKDSLLTMAGLAHSGANNGELWHDTTQKCLQTFVAGIQQSLSGVLFTNSARSTVTGATTDTTVMPAGVGTLTLPANFFVAGKAVRITVKGHLKADSTHTLTVSALYGATGLAQIAHVQGSNVTSYTAFEYECTVVCLTTGASGTVAVNSRILTPATIAAFTVASDGSSTVTINTTTSNALDLQVKWSTAGANNSWLVNSVVVEALN